MSDPVTYALDGRVATLALNRPERMNALSPDLFDAWQAAIDRAQADGTRALVMTGEGSAFCAGADLHAKRESGAIADLSVSLETYYNPLIRRIASLDIPVVTAVNGPAVGAGMGFALAGDMVVAARSAYFLLAFVNIGLVPDAGSTWLVARAVGRARAMELALLGERLSADDALAMGLVNRVVEDGAALVEAQRIAARLAQGAGVAIGLIRKQVAYALDHDFDATLVREAENQREAGRSRDFAEAVAAFGEKRKPVFEGR